MRAVFITGTDTGAGKTTVSELLGRFLSDRGYLPVAHKWIQTGKENFPTDYLQWKFAYKFKFPSSPHLAANLEKRVISTDKIKNSFRALEKRFDFIIVEGIGGALVPFNRQSLVIDIAKMLNLPVLIVANNKLGAINHTLLTIEALRKRKMKIIGIIFNNQCRKTSKIILKDNVKIVKKLTGERILGILPYNKDKNRLYRAFLPIGRRVYQEIRLSGYQETKT